MHATGHHERASLQPYLKAGLMRKAHGLHLLNSVWVLQGVNLIMTEVYVWQRHLTSTVAMMGMQTTGSCNVFMQNQRMHPL